ncbi:lipase [Nocardia nova SH22a]|uniref:Lipase n=1 Tax=Nocardia nova SH22a TaxID=1415166 RepID=W5TED0_9NOCA|nr:lipase family protein [Nocardia nova]AHH17700.1 lipase [Nocardia nova SH22a]
MGVFRKRAIRTLTAVVGAQALACAAVSLGANGAAAQPPEAGIFAAAPARQADDFYTPPSNLAAAAPGDVLRSRPVDLPGFFSLATPVRAWQLLYRTTDAHGRPAATATTVVRPASGRPGAIVSYQLPEDASTADCAPTRFIGTDPAARADATPAMLALDLGPVNALLAQGFAVSIPDYEGPASEWGAARQPGYGVLDGVRAAERFDQLGLPGTATPAALWGYSGGSLASGWAAEVQRDYAPELDIRGVALGGFLTDPAQAIVRTIGTVFAGVPISVLPGLIRTNPDLVAEFIGHLTPSGKTLLQTAGSQCMAENTLAHSFVDLSAHMDMPFRDFMELPRVRSAFADLNLGTTAPAAPLFVYHSVNDEMVPITGVDRTVAGYCAAGASVTYVRDEASEHGLLSITGAPAALDWLSQRLTGDRTRPACTTRTVPSALILPNSLPQNTRNVLADMQTRANTVMDRTR